MFKESWVFGPDFPEKEVFAWYQGQEIKEEKVYWGEVDWEKVVKECRDRFGWEVKNQV